MNPIPVTEADLHAYVDGVLPQARRAEVDAYLALRPAEAQRLQAYAEQNLALRARFRPVLDEALPRGLAAPPPRRQWQRYAAALLLTLGGGAAGWLLHDARDGAPPLQARAAAPALHMAGAGLARQAAIAHAVYSPEIKHPVEVGAEQEAHLVAWLSKRLGTPVRPPRLGKLGYELIGGRLLPGDSGPVAQFMYQGATGQRLTLYVSAEQAGNRDTGFRFAQQGRVNVFYWIDGAFGYALSAGIDKAELSGVAALVYEQLAPRP